MRIAAIIPARYASSRFPGKPLVMIHGKSMIMRVYEQAVQAGVFTEVIVATDDSSILLHVQKQGGKAVMTSEHHRSGTERCAEAIIVAGLENAIDAVVNIQGDEPYIQPEQIVQLADCLRNADRGIATLVKKITDVDELLNPGVVKVVRDFEGRAIYFSRHPIPFIREFEKEQWLRQYVFYKHIGIYGYHYKILKQIVDLPMAAIEQSESLEQLRWLYNGYPVFTAETDYESLAVDTPEDLLKLINKPCN
ncbi:MAG: 3-deoxy-manno-octulosonate cytidylyltransferase [Bacteroidales bacterium]|nr:3-deoxy-manno-octulosonate cytidylyltransferase [Bacteroidales bacterium]